MKKVMNHSYKNLLIPNFGFIANSTAKPWKLQGIHASIPFGTGHPTPRASGSVFRSPSWKAVTSLGAKLDALWIGEWLDSELRVVYWCLLCNMLRSIPRCSYVLRVYIYIPSASQPYKFLGFECKPRLYPWCGGKTRVFPKNHGFGGKTRVFPQIRQMRHRNLAWAIIRWKLWRKIHLAQLVF